MSGSGGGPRFLMVRTLADLWPNYTSHPQIPHSASAPRLSLTGDVVRGITTTTWGDRMLTWRRKTRVWGQPDIGPDPDGQQERRAGGVAQGA